jgi:hypothetical protein
VRCCRLKTSIFLCAYSNVAPGVACGLGYLLVGQGLAIRTLLTSYGLFVSLLAAVAVMAATAFVLNAPASLMTAVLLEHLLRSDAVDFDDALSIRLAFRSQFAESS